MRGFVGRLDRYAWMLFLVLPMATLGLFMGVRTWGAGPTVVVLAATPAVNILIGLFLGRRISLGTIVGFSLVLEGVVLARWGGGFSLAGLAWSLLATIASAGIYELFSLTKSSAYEKCFVGSLGMGLVGLMFSLGQPWQAIGDPKNIMLLVAFSFVGGFLYWMANLVAFKNLPTNEASVLAQGETPVVIVSAMFLLGERMTLGQWFGVAIAITGAALITLTLSPPEHNKGAEA